MTLKFQWANHEIKGKTIRIPYGWKKPEYALAPGDTLKEFVPDYDLVPYIEKALESVNNGTSLRDAANWLTVASNCPISHVGLKNLWSKVVVNPEDTDRQARLDTWRKPKTREEKKQRRFVERKAAAKRAITINQKKLTRLSNTSNNKDVDDDSSVGSNGGFGGDAYSELPPETTIIFEPNPGPQTDFLAASELEVLYGGAAGGGKSFAILADPMRYFHHPGFNGLLLRRTMDELRDLIRESKLLYTKAFPGAKFNNQTSTWTFPAGGQLWMAYLDRDDDVERYRGQQFTWIGVDELTQYATPYAWDFLRSRCRNSSSNRDLPLCMRATTNPGGPGHQWVKKAFIDPAPPNTSFIARNLETGELQVYPKGHEKEGQPLFKRRFIPAKLSDNKYLHEDGQYEATLLSLPEHLRRQLLDGDWSVSQGAAFPEFRDSIHVVDPYPIPPDWRRFRSCDYAYSSNSAVLWFAVNPVDLQLVVYRELYTTKVTGRELGAMITNIERQAGERMAYGVMDSSVFHTRGNSGPVISEEMAAEGARFRPSDRGPGSRIAGRNRLHELLKTHEIGFDLEAGKPIEAPGIVFFSNCRQTINDLKSIPTDPKGGEDVDERYVSDHTYDALRYGIMTRIRGAGFTDSPQAPRPADSKFGY